MKKELDIAWKVGIAATLLFGSGCASRITNPNPNETQGRNQSHTQTVGAYPTSTLESPVLPNTPYVSPVPPIPSKESSTPTPVFTSTYTSFPTSAETSTSTLTPTYVLTSTITTAQPAEGTPTQAFETMDIGTVEKHGKVTWEQIQSGQFDWNVLQHVQPFPDDAVSKGWKLEYPGPHSLVIQNPGSKDNLQLVTVCDIDDSFEGLPGRKSYVAAIAVKGSDNVVLKIFLNDERYLNGFLRYFKDADGKLGTTWSYWNGIDIHQQLDPDQTKRFWNGQYAPMFRLYPTEGQDKIWDVAAKMTSSEEGLPDELKGVLVIYSIQ